MSKHNVSIIMPEYNEVADIDMAVDKIMNLHPYFKVIVGNDVSRDNTAKVAMDNDDLLFAVVVTFNRKTILKKCINSLLSQTLELDGIIIIDNCSTDGTDAFVEREFKHNKTIIYQRLDKNEGGAGGFYFGTKLAIENGAGWVWLMDDDCMPDKECLKNLMTGIDNKKDIYSPIILSLEDKKTVLWGIKAKVNAGKHEVVTLPFNGFLVHRQTIQEIGFPDKRFFIYGDDAEYNFRAKSFGSKSIIITDSIMYHPFKNQVKGLNIIKMFMSKIWVYYKLRNAVIIFHKYRYYSIKQILMLVLSLFFFTFTLHFNFIRLWFAAVKDGLENRLYVRDI